MVFKNGPDQRVQPGTEVTTGSPNPKKPTENDIHILDFFFIKLNAKTTNFVL